MPLPTKYLLLMNPLRSTFFESNRLYNIQHTAVAELLMHKLNTKTFHKYYTLLPHLHHYDTHISFYFSLLFVGTFITSFIVFLSYGHNNPKSYLLFSGYSWTYYNSPLYKIFFLLTSSKHNFKLYEQYIAYTVYFIIANQPIQFKYN